MFLLYRAAARGACLVRRPVLGLRYEAYAALAEREGRAIMDEARARFAIEAAACVHRVGALEIGELAVWVGASAAHRDAAFAACRWIIDEVKSRVPIWNRTVGVTWSVAFGAGKINEIPPVGLKSSRLTYAFASCRLLISNAMSSPSK